ncbi:MAG TPA: hypothetical protein VHB49_15160 [Bradyrhizobium sp.]|nr:hypothetical protein [Bradyrhizobium sp.]
MRKAKKNTTCVGIHDFLLVYRAVSRRDRRHEAIAPSPISLTLTVANMISLRVKVRPHSSKARERNVHPGSVGECPDVVNI